MPNKIESTKQQHLVTKAIDDDYEASQLVPEYIPARPSSPATVSAAVEAFRSGRTKLPGSDYLPVNVASRARLAVFEAIVDSEIENVLDEAEEQGITPTSGDVEEAVSPLVDTAVALHIVPSTAKGMVARLVANRIKHTSPQTRLLVKAAEMVTDAFVTMEDGEAAELPEHKLDETAEHTDINVVEEVVEPTQDEIQVDEDVPETPAETMRYLASAAVNKRKATALVSRHFSGVLLQHMTHQLKPHLSDRFIKKYRVR